MDVKRPALTQRVAIGVAAGQGSDWARTKGRVLISTSVGPVMEAVLRRAQTQLVPSPVVVRGGSNWRMMAPLAHVSRQKSRPKCVYVN